MFHVSVNNNIGECVFVHTFVDSEVRGANAASPRIVTGGGYGQKAIGKNLPLTLSGHHI